MGSCGLQVEEAGERARLSIYFAAGPELDMGVVMREIERHLSALDLVPPPMTSEAVAVRDWDAEWRRFFRPVWATPRIVIHPSWIPVATEGDQIAVTIDPKMAFGTGGHESTQLCLQAMECHVRVDMRCMDLGAGSGILSIAAVRLGAGSVLAVDIDAVAVDNARQNIDRNGIAPERIENINIKGKVVVRLDDGEVRSSSLKQYREWARPACLYCLDYGAENADIGAGGIGMDDWTMTVVRTDAGHEALQAAIDDGKIETRPLDVEPKGEFLAKKLSSVNIIRLKFFCLCKLLNGSIKISNCLLYTSPSPRD